MKHWDLWATIAGLIVFTTWSTIRLTKWQGHRMPTFADCVDTFGCIGMLIVVTNWLGLWDMGPRTEKGSLAYGEGLMRLGVGVLKAVFLVFVPSLFLVNGMRMLGGLGLRSAIYGAVIALALVIWFVRR
jgi:hypothetical protein